MDGGRTIKSKKLQIWPLVATVVELPPLLRNSYRNVIWLGLWYSSTSKPNWTLMLNLMESELSESLIFAFNESIFEVTI